MIWFLEIFAARLYMFVRIINEDIGYIRFDNVGDDRSRCELLIELNLSDRTIV